MDANLNRFDDWENIFEERSWLRGDKFGRLDQPWPMEINLLYQAQILRIRSKV